MTKKEWTVKIKRLCKKAGTYEDYFMPVIESLSEILEKRDEAERHYVETGSCPVVEHTNQGGNTNTTKNPCLVLWNDLNTSALAYWRDLGLTPSALKKQMGTKQPKEKTSALVEALKGL